MRVRLAWACLLAFVIGCATPGHRPEPSATALAEQGLQLYRTGSYHAAIERFEAAAELQARGGDHAGRAHTLNNLARLRNLVGDYPRALGDLDEALAITEHSPALKAQTLVNVGTIHLNLRRYRDAAAALEQAYALGSQSGAEDTAAEALTVLGAVYRQQGDFAQAQREYERAREIRLRHHHASEVATLDRVLGELYLNRSDGDKTANLGQAHDYLRRALEQHRRDREGLGEAMADSHLGEYFHQRRQYDTAVEHYRAALAYFERVGYVDGIGRMQIHLGAARSEAGQYTQAIASFDRALAVYAELGDREWLRVALYGRGLALERRGETAGAERDYRDAVDVFESLRADVAGGETAEALFTRVNSALYERLVALLLRRGAVETALEYVERSRLKALRDALLNADSAPRRTRGEPALTELAALTREQRYLLEQARRAPTPAVRSQMSESLARNETEATRVVFDLSRRYRGIEHTLDIVPNTRAFRHQPAFPADLGLVTYFVTEQALYIFLVKKGRDVVVKRIALDSKTLGERVAAAIVLIGRARDAGPSSELIAALHALYRVLLGPIEAELAGLRTLAVLPSEWLAFLPFEALVSGMHNGQPVYLLEQRHVVYLAAQTYAGQVLRLTERAGARRLQTVAAFGNPDLGDARYALPYAEIEVGEIARLFKSSATYVRQAASKANFLAAWGRYQALHIAAHARLSRSQLEILLAPGRGGALGFDDLFALPANEATAFVALSACQTAVDPELAATLWRSAGEAGGNGPIASAAHALLLLGIPSIAASLWKVDDQATALLMSDFYRRLRGGADYYAALRAAQLTLLGRKDRYRQPYYWAGFVFYGMDR